MEITGIYSGKTGPELARLRKIFETALEDVVVGGKSFNEFGFSFTREDSARIVQLLAEIKHGEEMLAAGATEALDYAYVQIRG